MPFDPAMPSTGHKNVHCLPITGICMKRRTEDSACQALHWSRELRLAHPCYTFTLTHAFHALMKTALRLIWQSTTLLEQCAYSIAKEQGHRC